MTDFTDAEIETALQKHSEHTVYNYNDLVAEVDRRDAKRTAEANVRLARNAVIIATVSVIVSAIGIVVSAIGTVIQVIR